MADMRNLQRVIEQLNSPVEIEGCDERFPSEFNFILEGNRLYDSNECYHIGYAEDQRWLLQSIGEEFGLTDSDFEDEDRIYNQLLEAVQADLGDNAYIEWENNVIMNIVE